MKMSDITLNETDWHEIYNANKQVIGANPNLIKPGQEFKMPDGSSYTVKPGDNLTAIAKNFKPTAATPPAATPPSGQSGQATPPGAAPATNPAATNGTAPAAAPTAQTPPATTPPVQVAQAPTLDNPRADVSIDPGGFDWDTLRRNAGIDASTGGYDKNGGAVGATQSANQIKQVPNGTSSFNSPTPIITTQPAAQTPPATNSTPPATNSTPPATNNTPPATNNTPPATNSAPPATSRPRATAESIDNTELARWRKIAGLAK